MSVLFITLLFFSINLQGFYYDIGIKVTPTDGIIAVWFFLELVSYLSGRTKINRAGLLYFLPHIFTVLYLVWNGFEAVVSPSIESGATLYLQMIRNFILMLMITLPKVTLADYRKINLAIFLIGVFFSVIGIYLYTKNFLNLASIVKDPEAWHGVVGFELDRSGYLRANGLTGDSNFYSIFLILSLLCGVSLHIAKSVRHIGILTIIVAILLAFSRSIFLALFAGPIIMMIMGLTPLSRKNLFYITVMILFLILASLLILWVFDINIIDVMSARFSYVGSEKRNYLWGVLLSMIEERPLLGHGLRAAQDALHFYSHNTYLDILVDTGLIGAVIFVLVILAIFIIMMKNKKNREILDDVRPWNTMLIITLIFSFFFSFGTSPFVWLLLSMAISAYKLGGNKDGSAHAPC